MELMDVITSKENLNKAYKKIKANKGAGGVDGMEVEEIGAYIRDNNDIIVQSIRNRTYVPKPVRRVYIPKDNGKRRPLGIPTVLDRVIQQAIAQAIIEIYEWVIDIDIEQFFDKVNHDKLIRILREQVNLKANEIKKGQKNISSELLASFGRQLTREDISQSDMHSISDN